MANSEMNAMASTAAVAMRRIVPPAFCLQRGPPRSARRGFLPETGLATAAHRAVHLALLLTLADRLALVVRVLAASERELDLRVAVGEVHARRHDGQAALAHPAQQAFDLAPVQQELARPVGLVVVHRRRLVGRD